MAKATERDKLVLAAFSRDFEYCWACGIWEYTRERQAIDYPRWLETHHIIRGSGRIHDRRNLARLCKLCHDLHHGHVIRAKGVALPPLSLGNVLWLKSRHDTLDREFLSDLRPKQLPRAARPDEFFFAEYHKWHVSFPGEPIGGQ